jgi:hypothetical protein
MRFELEVVLPDVMDVRQETSYVAISSRKGVEDRIGACNQRCDYTIKCLPDYLRLHAWLWG